MQFQKNDIVRRKGDPSPRTRVVVHAQRDGNGSQHILLDDYLDGWLIWNARKLELVTRPPSHVEKLAHLLHSRRHA